MGMVNSIIKMVECMMGIGKKIKWRVLANYTISLENWLTKDNGKMINL